MEESERLRDRLTEDMKSLEDPDAQRDSWSIAQLYASAGYDLTLDEIQAHVRDVARELGVSVA